MKNLKVSKKIIISYATILLLLVTGIVVSIVNLANIGKKVQTFYDGPFTVKGSSNIINSNFEAMQKSVYRSLSAKDPAIISEAIENANKYSEVIQQQLPIVKEHFTGDQEIINRLQDALTKLAPMRETVLNLASQQKIEEAQEYMESNNVFVIQEAQNELNTLIEIANDKSEELIKNLREIQARSIVILTILGIGSVAVSTVFGFYLTKNITKPVAELEAAAKDLANGILDTNITYESKDEIGGLAQSMRVTVMRLSEIINDMTKLLTEISEGNFVIQSENEEGYIGAYRPLLLSVRKMNLALNNAMSQINQSADQVFAGSDQVSSGAQALSQGATEQASSVEELAATVTGISEQVGHNAQSAQTARNTVDEVGQKLLVSNQQMQDMTLAMGEISDSSKEIKKIIKTIEDIAFQTNILALNAAVEAARAGTAGKGFSVVADEVRNLASKSSEASKSTSALIEKSLQAVERGKKIADDTAASLLGVVDGTKEITIQVSQIAQASKEQAASVSLISQGIDQISSVVQTNSATAEESAAASEELTGQAQMLKDLVKQFKFKHDSTSAPSSFDETDYQELSQENVKY